MKILVTGGAGFIGSAVVDGCLAAGHDVAVVDDLSSGAADNVDRRARWYRVDIRSSDLDGVFATERPDVVSHHGIARTWPWFADKAARDRSAA